MVFSPLPEIGATSRNIDTVWGLLTFQGKRYILGNVYLKLDHDKRIDELNVMLKQAEKLVAKHRASGTMVAGDFNARHQMWNNSTINKYGKLLEKSDSVDWSKYSIIAPSSLSSPTFLSSNGHSLIDFYLVSNALSNKFSGSTTDTLANLYSGAPIRGHVPVHVTLHPSKTGSHFLTQIEVYVL